MINGQNIETEYHCSRDANVARCVRCLGNVGLISILWIF